MRDWIAFLNIISVQCMMNILFILLLAKWKKENEVFFFINETAGRF